MLPSLTTTLVLATKWKRRVYFYSKRLHQTYNYLISNYVKQMVLVIYWCGLKLSSYVWLVLIDKHLIKFDVIIYMFLFNLHYAPIVYFLDPTNVDCAKLSLCSVISCFFFILWLSTCYATEISTSTSVVLRKAHSSAVPWNVFISGVGQYAVRWWQTRWPKSFFATFDLTVTITTTSLSLFAKIVVVVKYYARKAAQHFPPFKDTPKAFDRTNHKLLFTKLI